jgi:deoxyribose-phosphate aldolase
MQAKELSKFFDHTILKPDATSDQIKKICDEALQYSFASVCVQPYYVRMAAKILENQESTKVCTVIDFPFGYSSTFAKMESIKKTIEHGAEEIDAVANVLAIKNDDWQAVKYDVESMKYLCLVNNTPLKLIFETCYLSLDDIEKLGQICVEFEVDFLKTSTGYGTAGATVEHVRLLKKIADDKSKVKASGGIKTLEQTMKMIEAGAERIGTSSAVGIMEELLSINK